MKQTPLTRRTPLKAKTGLKRGGTPKRAGKKVAKKRTKLPTVQSMRKKCDALLTPIVKLDHPNCLICSAPTQVAHHHIKKSTSNSCRYYLPNLVPLCNPCHARLHHDELLWCGRVVKIMGFSWLDDLEAKKKEDSKCDIHWYIEHHTRLKALLDKI